MARVAVVGSGFIGRAWAITFARAGHDVALWDQDPDAPQRAIDFIASVVPDLAANDLLEALKLAPSHFGARATLADVYVKAGKSPEALAAFNKLVELFPENPLSMNNRGMYLQSTGKLEDAIVDFTRAVERDPNYFVAYSNRGYTLLQMDKCRLAHQPV